MTHWSIIVAGLGFMTLSATTVILMVIALSGRRRLAVVGSSYASLQQQARDVQRESALLAQGNEALAAENGELRALVQHKEDLIRNLENENNWFRAELDKRPKMTRKTYKVLTLGVKHTGKTSLTLKWANPLVDLGTLQGTKIERYERTISRVVTKDVATEHVFEIGDWGGEHIVDAQQELVLDEIHGLLMVVDLAGKEGKALDKARIEEQLRAFRPQVLKYFFGPKTLASCKTIVLFINKSDVLSGTPAEIEQQARGYYQPLIDSLERYKGHVDVRVLVGSASYGHSTHHLFSHFVERVLPKNAYDVQLLQRMKADAVPASAPPARPFVRPSKPTAAALGLAR